jgi:CPA1 family monovalent cation:H+ antiporter
MRGVVSLAVALSVPDEFPGRDFMLATALVAILVSILVQGTTLVPLIRVLGLTKLRSAPRASLSEAQTRVEMARAALAAVKAASTADDGSERHPRLVEQYGRKAEMAARFVDDPTQISGKRADHFSAVLAANRASRAELLKLHRAGEIHDSVLKTLEVELDLEEISALRSMQDPKL